MRFWPLVAPITALAVLASAGPALASCAPPAPLAERVQRAHAVVHGRVTATSVGALQVAVLRTLKGSVPASVNVYVGPSRGAGGTSVDYTMDHKAGVGTEHVLFIMNVADGYEINACNGSHPGGLSPEELAFFGGATTPAPTTRPAETAEPRPVASAVPEFDPRRVALTAAAGLVAAIAGFAVIRRLRQI